MAYEELVQWMFNLERFGIKLGLENMAEFLARTGDPHRDFKTIHVTGTNGKGSVCAFLASVLTESGFKTGLYTSPHMVDFRERIAIDGVMIPEEDVVRIGGELRETMEAMAKDDSEKQLTFFEFTTGLAFRYFSEEKVDFAVIEVGMGGRLDATNLIAPEVTGITRIGLEHTTYLGNTLQDIAREKAGIIKEGISLVSCERNRTVLPIIENACARKGADLMLIGRDFDVVAWSPVESGSLFDYAGVHDHADLSIPLMGRHQVENVAMAVALAEELECKGFSIPEEALRRGLSRTSWRGRLDIVSKDPMMIFDGSHNPEGVETSVQTLQDQGLAPLTYVVACMSDKDSAGIIRALAPTAARMIVTQVDIGRSMKASDLFEITRGVWQGDIRAVDNTVDALQLAFDDYRGKGVCVIGSFYLVGEAMKWLDRMGSMDVLNEDA